MCNVLWINKSFYFIDNTFEYLLECGEIYHRVFDKILSIECQIYFDKVSTTAKLYKEFKYILGIDLDKGINGA